MPTLLLMKAMTLALAHMCTRTTRLELVLAALSRLHAPQYRARTANHQLAALNFHAKVVTFSAGLPAAVSSLIAIRNRMDGHALQTHTYQTGMKIAALASVILI